MGNFLHRLFNPHCPECRLELECPNCDVLKEQLLFERSNNEKLMKSLLELVNPTPKVSNDVEVRLPLSPKNMPWSVRQQMLEAEDRKKFELIRAKTSEQTESTKSTEQLEKEILEGEENDDRQSNGNS